MLFAFILFLYINYFQGDIVNFCNKSSKNPKVFKKNAVIENIGIINNIPRV